MQHNYANDITTQVCNTVCYTTIRGIHEKLLYATGKPLEETNGDLQYLF